MVDIRDGFLIRILHVQVSIVRCRCSCFYSPALILLTTNGTVALAAYWWTVSWVLFMTFQWTNFTGWILKASTVVLWIHLFLINNYEGDRWLKSSWCSSRGPEFSFFLAPVPCSSWKLITPAQEDPVASPGLHTHTQASHTQTSQHTHMKYKHTQWNINLFTEGFWEL